jgi:hypothetical protein
VDAAARRRGHDPQLGRVVVPYNAELLNTIIYLIGQNATRITDTGTVSSRSADFYDNKIMVQFEGSNVATPVKAFGNVEVLPGDRVGLVKFGPPDRGEWVVVGTFSRRWPAQASRIWSGTGTYASSTLTDMPSAPTITMAKRWNDTALRVIMLGSAYPGVAFPGVVAFGFRYAVNGGADTSVGFGEFGFNQDEHSAFGASATYTGVGWEAGTYTFVAQWAYVGGSGNINVNPQDPISLLVAEVSP